MRTSVVSLLVKTLTTRNLVIVIVRLIVLGDESGGALAVAASRADSAQSNWFN